MGFQIKGLRMWVPYFRDEENWEKYREEVISWEGTPYRHLKMVKGKGADCTLFIGAQWLYMGILTKVEYEYYPRDWHIHAPSEYVIQQLHYHWQNFSAPGLDIAKIDTRNEEDFIRGDILCFAMSVTGVTNHATIWFGDFRETRQKRQMYNSINTNNNRGVCRISYGSFWKSRLTNIFRVMREV